MRFLKGLVKWIGILLIIFDIFLAAFVIILENPSVQTWLANRATSYLSNKLNTRVTVGGVDVDYPFSLVLQKVYVEDQQKDTLLYAGELKAGFNFINIFQKKFIINGVSLSDAYFNMIEKDTIHGYNFQFILDAFASKDTSSKSSSSSLELKLHELTLKNIRYRLLNVQGYNEIKVGLPYAQFVFDSLDLNTGQIFARTAELNKAQIAITNLLNPHPDTTESNDESIAHINTKKFRLNVKSLALNDADFKMDNENAKPQTSGFDTHHLHFSNINLDVNNGGVLHDTIYGNIKNLRVKEKSGLDVRQFSALTKITTTHWDLKNLNLQLPHSLLTNSFSFQYKTFSDFKDFVNRVKLNGSLQNSRIMLSDLAGFAPDLKNYSQSFIITGNIKGTISDLKCTDMDIRFGKSSSLTGKIEFNGLPQIEQTFLDADVNNLTTNAADMQSLISGLVLPGNIYQLGGVNFKGSFTGFFRDFVAYGQLNCALGQLNSDLQMKIAGNNMASYSGEVSANKFNIGKFAEVDSLLGIISCNVKLNGSGLRASNVDATIIGQVDSLFFNHYLYKNIRLDGTFDKKLFSGKLLVNDKNVHLSFNGKVDFNNSLPNFNFIAQVDSANLLPLHFAGRNLILSAGMNLNIRGNAIDNLDGGATASNIIFRNGRDTFHIAQISLEAHQQDSVKHLSLLSDLLTFHADGQFLISEMPRSFLYLIKNYFSSLPLSFPEPSFQQDFTFSLNTNQTENFLHFFFPNIIGFDSSNLSGSFSSAKNDLAMTGTIPFIRYNNQVFQNVTINSFTKGPRFVIALRSKKYSPNDSLHFDRAYFQVNSSGDTAGFRIAGHDSLQGYSIDLKGNFSGNDSVISFHLKPSNLEFANNTWHIDPDNEIIFVNNNLTISNFIVKHDSESVRFYSDVSNSWRIHSEIKNLHIAPLYNVLRFNAISIDGILNSEATIDSLFSSPRVSWNGTIKNFEFNGDTLGLLKNTVTLSGKNKSVDLVVSVDGDKDNFDVDGNINWARKDSNLNFDGNIKKLDLNIFQKYIATVFSNVHGSVNGNVHVGGPFSSPDFTGTLLVNDASAHMVFQNVTYHFKQALIDIEPDVIDLGAFTLYDEKSDTAQAGGEIFDDNFNNLDFNIFINTNNFLGLNTTVNDNTAFYGTAYAGGIIQITGPPDALNISATLQSRPGTAINIPISEAASVSEHSFVKFVSYKDSSLLRNELFEAKNSNLTLDFNMDVRPDAQVQIIFNQKSGDIIKGNGSGNLRVLFNTSGDFSIFGNYTINSGSYSFTIPNYFNPKFFTLNPGGTIVWNGDPYDARISISAIYTTRAALIDLFGSSAQSLTDEQQKEAAERQRVDLYMNLTGSLLHPDIAFDIQLPDESSTINSFALQQLQIIKQNENELNNQAFGLLIVNRFLPVGNLSNGGDYLSSGAINSLTEWFGDQLSSILSQGLNKYNIGIVLNYNISNTAISQDAITRYRELTAQINKSFFNNRITVSAGADYDFGTSTYATSNTNYLTGDFEAQIKLRGENNYLTVFTRGQYDAINNRNAQKSGVGFKHSRTFNFFYELFHKQKLVEPPPSTTAPAASTQK
jgi:hypothetical protein